MLFFQSVSLLREHRKQVYHSIYNVKVFNFIINIIIKTIIFWVCNKNVRGGGA